MLRQPRIDEISPSVLGMHTCSVDETNARNSDEGSQCGGSEYPAAGGMILIPRDLSRADY